MSLVNPAGDDNTNSGSSANAGGDPALIAQICSMGFSTEHAKFALKKNNNNGDVAVMWPSRLRTSIIMFICSAIANLLYSYIMSFLNLDYASLGKHLVEMEKEFVDRIVDRIGHELVYWNNNNGPCCKIS
jgi:hypothetical protein